MSRHGPLKSGPGQPTLSQIVLVPPVFLLVMWITYALIVNV